MSKNKNEFTILSLITALIINILLKKKTHGRFIKKNKGGFFNKIIPLIGIAILINISYGIYNPNYKYKFDFIKITTMEEREEWSRINAINNEHLIIKDIEFSKANKDVSFPRLKIDKYKNLSKDEYLNEIWMATNNLVNGSYGSSGFKKETILMSLHFANKKSNATSNGFPLLISFNKENIIKTMSVFDDENPEIYSSYDRIKVTDDGYNFLSSNKITDAEILNIYKDATWFLIGIVIFLILTLSLVIYFNNKYNSRFR